jgi:hypothetical protein
LRRAKVELLRRARKKYESLDVSFAKASATSVSSTGPAVGVVESEIIRSLQDSDALFRLDLRIVALSGPVLGYIPASSYQSTGDVSVQALVLLNNKFVGATQTRPVLAKTDPAQATRELAAVLQQLASLDSLSGTQMRLQYAMPDNVAFKSAENSRLEVILVDSHQHPFGLCYVDVSLLMDSLVGLSSEGDFRSFEFDVEPCGTLTVQLRLTRLDKLAPLESITGVTPFHLQSLILGRTVSLPGAIAP